MQSAREREQINNFLGRAGFAQTTEPAALIRQLAFIVRDHAHLSQLLAKCDPAQRVSMYESLRPNLRFEAKPLDVYMAEIKLDAEIRQLPAVASDGSLQPFRAPEVESDAYVIQKAIADSLAKHTLVLTCVKCMRAGEFRGVRKSDAIFAARNAGWTYDELNGTGREICPRCPAGRAKQLN